MARIRPFAGIRPRAEKAGRIAALPYDVYSRKEAKAEVEREPESFLRVDRAETQFADTVDMYAPEVYQRARDTLWNMVAEGDLLREETPCYYIYELTMDGRSQTGVAGCAAIDDYLNGVIKKHEYTRYEKEQDRVRHVDACNAQTGPIFLAYRDNETVDRVVAEEKTKEPVYDFFTPDAVRHRVWVIRGEREIGMLRQAFAGISRIYIADGHHRCASAVQVGLRRRAEHSDYTGEEEYNYFLSVLFPDRELRVMDYNRVVLDLNGLTEEEFLQCVRERFDVTRMADGSGNAPEAEEANLPEEQVNPAADSSGKAPEAEEANLPEVQENPPADGSGKARKAEEANSPEEQENPAADGSGNAPEAGTAGTPEKQMPRMADGSKRPWKKGVFTMYLGRNWYACRIRADDLSADPVKGLDVSLLQDLLLDPVLGIKDPKTDPRIDFVGGIRGTEELERRCREDAKAAFAMYPTSINELFAVADADLMMPPKSTWFEPKLRSGILIHEI